jgi:hypothetical protein
VLRSPATHSRETSVSRKRAAERTPLARKISARSAIRCARFNLFESPPKKTFSAAMHDRSARKTHEAFDRTKEPLVLGQILIRRLPYSGWKRASCNFRSPARCLPPFRNMNRTTARVFPLQRCVAAVSIAGALLLSLDRNARASRIRTNAPSARRSTAAPSSPRTSEGRVVEVRRTSRELTVQTPRGAIEHVVIPTDTAIRAPNGSSALSGIRAGMALRAEGQADERGRIIARELVAH